MYPIKQANNVKTTLGVEKTTNQMKKGKTNTQIFVIILLDSIHRILELSSMIKLTFVKASIVLYVTQTINKCVMQAYFETLAQKNNALGVFVIQSQRI